MGDSLPMSTLSPRGRHRAISSRVQRAGVVDGLCPVKSQGLVIVIIVVVFALLPTFAPIILLIVISPTASWWRFEWVPGCDLVGSGELHESGHDDLQEWQAWLPMPPI